MKGRLPTPDEQRAHQELKDKAVRAWATDHGVGTKPSSFPEVLRVPVKSTKNIKRKK